MTHRHKQRLAIAVIVILGALGAGVLLLAEPAGQRGLEAGHAVGAPAAKDEHGSGANANAEAKKDHDDDAEVKLTAAQREAAGIAVQAAGPATLRVAARFQGEIRFDDDRTAHVVPRFAGVAESVSVTLGQVVSKGQLLAVVASPQLAEQRSEWLTARQRRELARTTFQREEKLWREGISAEQDYLQATSALQEADIAVQNATQKLAAVGAGGTGQGGLNRFDIRAPFAGTVVEKHLSLGEAVKEDASLFTITDLGKVWAEFAVAPTDLAAVRVGQRVVVSSAGLDRKAEGVVAYVGALLGEQTRTARARVTLANPQGAWRPGLFVSVAVLGDEQTVAVAVRTDALQTIDDQPVLFVVTPDGFKAQRVKLGRNDGTTAEVLDGLAPGDRYAAANTFVLKSELGKAGAEHGH